MKIRFGYVSTALNLWENSPSRALTFARWSKMERDEANEKLYSVCQQNLQSTMRILHYNVAHQIHLYRMSSAIIPLATHPDVQFDYIGAFHKELAEMGEFIKKHKLRVSFHPNQFTLFTSPREDVTEKAIEDMKYHFNILKAMGVEHSATINIHIGGAYGDKETTLLRFYENFKRLPKEILHATTLENDDKTYQTDETLYVCEKVGVPMVFDYHHHMANLCETPLEELIPRILHTWKGREWPPKIHISSPKTEKEFRSHANFVDAEFVKPFVTLLREYNEDVDFMIEAKNKDQAALQLVEDMSKWRGFKRIEEATIELK